MFIAVYPCGAYRSPDESPLPYQAVSSVRDREDRAPVLVHVTSGDRIFFDLTRAVEIFSGAAGCRSAPAERGALRRKDGDKPPQSDGAPSVFVPYPAPPRSEAEVPSSTVASFSFAGTGGELRPLPQIERIRQSAHDVFARRRIALRINTDRLEPKRQDAIRSSLSGSPYRIRPVSSGREATARPVSGFLSGSKTSRSSFGRPPMPTDT